MSKLSAAQAADFMSQTFPHTQVKVQELDAGHALITLRAGPTHLRPGGYISGPTQMAMADTAAYLVVMSKLGVTPMAVTSNLNIHFLRPCVGEAVQAVGTLLRIGRRSAVVRVDVRAVGSEKQASEVTVTYALPE